MIIADRAIEKFKFETFFLQILLLDLKVRQKI